MTTTCASRVTRAGRPPSRAGDKREQQMHSGGFRWPAASPAGRLERPVCVRVLMWRAAPASAGQHKLAVSCASRAPSVRFRRRHIKIQPLAPPLRRSFASATALNSVRPARLLLQSLQVATSVTVNAAERTRARTADAQGSQRAPLARARLACLLPLRPLLQPSPVRSLARCVLLCVVRRCCLSSLLFLSVCGAQKGFVSVGRSERGSKQVKAFRERAARPCAPSASPVNHFLCAPSTWVDCVCAQEGSARGKQQACVRRRPALRTKNALRTPPSVGRSAVLALARSVREKIPARPHGSPNCSNRRRTAHVNRAASLANAGGRDGAPIPRASRAARAPPEFMFRIEQMIREQFSLPSPACVPPPLARSLFRVASSSVQPAERRCVCVCVRPAHTLRTLSGEKRAVVRFPLPTEQRGSEPLLFCAQRLLAHDRCALLCCPAVAARAVLPDRQDKG
jgi:hypothetical protein